MKTAFINGNVITADEHFSRAEAFLVDGEKFACVGTIEEVLKAAGEGCATVDLGGKTVLPGFNDSHLHLLNYAYGLSKFDCSRASSIDEMVEQCRKYIEEK